MGLSFKHQLGLVCVIMLFLVCNYKELCCLCNNLDRRKWENDFMTCEKLDVISILDLVSRLLDLRCIGDGCGFCGNRLRGIVMQLVAAGDHDKKTAQHLEPLFDSTTASSQSQPAQHSTTASASASLFIC